MTAPPPIAEPQPPSLPLATRILHLNPGVVIKRQASSSPSEEGEKGPGTEVAHTFWGCGTRTFWGDESE